MDLERWQRIKEAFATAIELPPGQRAAWLAAALPDDPSLVAEVESLLASASQPTADDFYEQGALAAVPEVRRQLEGVAEGMRLGPYRLLSELGRGGMGAVYLAVRDQPGFTQKVAIKLIKRGMDTDEIVRRFVAERQILAALAHPNIARLFDGGSTPDGRPYFVMEYVEGRPITVYADERKLPVEARLRLFVRVCRAVQNAHQSLVVHRDLKPANILVDAEGEPKLLDFGIAKLLDPSSFEGMTALTGLTPGPMTPEYASPEQRTGGTVTTATDVYGLGLLLYELLVGQSPRSVERQLGDGWADRPPSQARVALGDAEARRLARRLAGDLDTIVGKALEVDPKRRYGTAAALAEDVERHLDQRPVVARRPTLAYRLGRTLARNKLAALLTLGVCLLAASYFYLVSRERDRAEAQYRRAQALNELLQGMLRSANPAQSRGETLTVRQVLDAGAEGLAGREARHDVETWAALHETLGVTYKDLGLYDDARKFLERALRLREQQPDPSREARLDIAGNWTLLGWVDLQQGRYAQSRRDFQKAVAIKERLLGPDALELARDWNGLGLVNVAERKADEAVRHFDRALAISRRAAGEGQRDLAETFNNIGYLAAAESRMARARVFFGATYRYYRSTFGADHPETVQALVNLAFVTFHRGEYAEAERLYQEIVDVRRHLLGPSHPDFARALLELATVQRHRGRLAPSRATLEELLEVRRQHRFPVDQNEAETWNLLGNVALDQNDLAAAEKALARSFEIYRSLPGEHRADLAGVLRGQSLARRGAGDLAGAIALARRSLDLTRAALGSEHPGAVDSLQLLGEFLQQDGQFSSAEAVYRQALKLHSGPEWADHTMKARTSIDLGDLLVETGRASEARPYLEDGLRVRRLSLEAGNPAIAMAESQLGACYAALGDGRARALLERGYRTMLAVQGPDHPDTRKTLELLRRLAAPPG